MDSPSLWLPAPVQRSEEQLRQAVLGQQYSELPRLATLYRESVEQWFRSLDAADPRIPEMAERTQEILHGAISQVRADREMLASQLAQLPKLKRFLQAPAEHGARIRFDG
jgi:hypothetical protein